MAHQAGLPIYIAAVHGALQLMPTGSCSPKSGTIFIKYLPPIDCSAWTEETFSANIEEVRQQIIEGQAELRELYPLG